MNDTQIERHMAVKMGQNQGYNMSLGIKKVELNFALELASIYHVNHINWEIILSWYLYQVDPIIIIDRSINFTYSAHMGKNNGLQIGIIVLFFLLPVI